LSEWCTTARTFRLQASEMHGARKLFSETHARTCGGRVLYKVRAAEGAKMDGREPYKLHRTFAHVPCLYPAHVGLVAASYNDIRAFA